jgi:hypothetical protein
MQNWARYVIEEERIGRVSSKTRWVESKKDRTIPVLEWSVLVKNSTSDMF